MSWLHDIKIGDKFVYKETKKVYYLAEVESSEFSHFGHYYVFRPLNWVGRHIRTRWNGIPYIFNSLDAVCDEISEKVIEKIKEEKMKKCLLGPEVKSEGRLNVGDEVVIRDSVSDNGFYAPFKLQLFVVSYSYDDGSYRLRQNSKYLTERGEMDSHWRFGKTVSRRVLVRKSEAEKAGWSENMKSGEKTMTKKQALQEQINKRQEKIKKLKDEVELDLLRIKFMEENNLEELDEKVFQAYQVLQISTSEKETEYEKAVMIANILKNS